MIIGLASPGIARTLEDGLDRIKRLLSEASAQGAEIVCFPEAYLPGLRGQDFEVLPFDQTQQERALEAVAQLRADLRGRHHPRNGEAHRRRPADRRRRHRRPGPAPGIPDQEPARSERGSLLRARKHPAALRGQRNQVRGRDLPRGLALSRDRALGGGAGRQDRLSSPPHGQRSDGRPPDAVGRQRRAVLREGDDDAQHREHDLLRQRQLRACAFRSRRRVSSPRPAGARRTCPTGRKACWCRPSRSKKPRACWPRGTRPSAIRNPNRVIP